MGGYEILSGRGANHILNLSSLMAYCFGSLPMRTQEDAQWNFVD
jgi:hypothetical protein